MKPVTYVATIQSLVTPDTVAEREVRVRASTKTKALHEVVVQLQSGEWIEGMARA